MGGVNPRGDPWGQPPGMAPGQQGPVTCDAFFVGVGRGHLPGPILWEVTSLPHGALRDSLQKLIAWKHKLHAPGMGKGGDSEVLTSPLNGEQSGPQLLGAHTPTIPREEGQEEGRLLEGGTAGLRELSGSYEPTSRD